MTGQLDPVSTAIGGLQEAVKNLSEALEKEIEASANYRKEMRQELATQTNAIAAVQTSVNTVAGSVKELDATVKEMQPHVDSYTIEKAEERGADKLKAKLYAGALAIGTVFGAAAGKAIEIAAKKFGS